MLTALSVLLYVLVGLVQLAILVHVGRRSPAPAETHEVFWGGVLVLLWPVVMAFWLLALPGQVVAWVIEWATMRRPKGGKGW